MKTKIMNINWSNPFYFESILSAEILLIWKKSDGELKNTKVKPHNVYTTYNIYYNFINENNRNGINLTKNNSGPNFLDRKS